MAEQLELHTFTGPHPTQRDLLQRMHEWGFTTRRTDGVHLVLRGPHGGTVRLLRSLLGRADAQLADKAARLVGVTTSDFWAGPSALTTDAAATPAPATDASSTGPAHPPRTAAASRDQVTALVLAAHTRADRPLGFDDVVTLCRGQITRAQARQASATLCRDGDLDRIRTGVYQWASGARAATRTSPAITGVPSADPVAATAQHSLVQPPSQPVPARPATVPPTTELFNQLFPRGVQMTADLLADFEQWTHLTERLAAHANAS